MNKEIAGRSVTLTLTNRCNLNCVYCYEFGKNNNSMTFDVAKKIIDLETSRQDDSMIIFELFGGEPFLEFNLIKEIYAYIETKQLKQWLMFATTNGTLIHDDVQTWLVEHKKHFVCGLSLDGTAEMHNANRSNSFSKIDLDFFLNLYPNQHVKMTISPKTLPTLYDGVVFIHNKGFRVSCNLAFGIDWSNAQNAQLLEIELSKLINFYLNNPKVEPCSILGINFDQLGYQNDNNTVRKWCGTGTHMHTYDTDGKCYPCQFFMPISAGKQRARELGTISFDEQIPIGSPISTVKLDNVPQSAFYGEIIRLLADNPTILSALGVDLPDNAVSGLLQIKDLMDAHGLVEKIEKVSNIGGLDGKKIKTELEIARSKIKPIEAKFREVVNEKFAITCFSEKSDSILMWSHYANKHTGFCVEYDFNKCYKLEALINLWPVLYSIERPLLPMGLFDFTDPNDVKLRDIQNFIPDLTMLLLSKSNIWDYEKEWRIVGLQNQLTDGHLLDLHIVSHIYLGANISEENVARIREEVKDIPIDRYKIDSSKYCLRLDNLG